MKEAMLPVGVPGPPSLAHVVDSLGQPLREGRPEDYLPILTGLAPFARKKVGPGPKGP